ncbi:hypothetical protein TNCV_1379801 [Trichonephila clavipes]|nr:hypothetical protein TNCV_1379801 [Trichonephila clavipes]
MNMDDTTQSKKLQHTTQSSRLHDYRETSEKRERDFQRHRFLYPTAKTSTFCEVCDFPVRKLLLPPAVLRLCTDLWDHGSGLVSLDQMGISPTTTTIFDYRNNN